MRSMTSDQMCLLSGARGLDGDGIQRYTYTIIQLVPSVVSLLLEVTSIILPIRAMTTSSIPT